MGVIGRAVGDFGGVLDMPAVVEGSASVRFPCLNAIAAQQPIATIQQ